MTDEHHDQADDRSPESLELPAPSGRRLPAWMDRHSLAVVVGATAVLGAIAVGCHVLLGGLFGRPDDEVPS